ncbi:MAG: hypothetical protein ACFB22_04690 [Rhodothalassiaceae bacterium]
MLDVTRDQMPRKPADAPPQRLSLADVTDAFFAQTRLFIALVVAGLALGSLHYALTPSFYRADAVLAASDDSDFSDLTSLAGLAGLASDEQGDLGEVEFLFRSRVLGAALLEDERLIAALLPDLVSGEPPGFVTKVKRAVFAVLGRPLPDDVTAEALRDAIQAKIDTETSDQGYLEVQFTDRDPAIAHYALHRIIETTLAIVSERQISRLKQQQDALIAILAEADQAMTVSAGRSLVERLQEQFLAKVTDQLLAARILEPPVQPSLPAGPNLLLYLLAYGALAVALYSVIVAVRAVRGGR